MVPFTSVNIELNLGLGAWLVGSAFPLLPMNRLIQTEPPIFVYLSYSVAFKVPFFIYFVTCMVFDFNLPVEKIAFWC
jgi:hypothetical protein